MRPIPATALAFIGRWEGCRLRAYLCPAGVWTVGYGHTGRDVHAGTEWTQEQAEAALLADIHEAASHVHAAVKREVIDDLTDNQYVALLSFTFNLGPQPKATLWKRLNGRQHDQVPAELQRWVYVSTPKGKVKLSGLVNRRAAEVVLWSTAEPGSLRQEPPSSFTRAEITPPATANPVPLVKQPAALAVGVSLLLGLPGAITKLIETLTPLTPQYPMAAQAVELLSHVSPIAVAVAGLVLYLQSKQAKQ